MTEIYLQITKIQKAVGMAIDNLHISELCVHKTSTQTER